MIEFIKYLQVQKCTNIGDCKTIMKIIVPCIEEQEKIEKYENINIYNDNSTCTL